MDPIEKESRTRIPQPATHFWPFSLRKYYFHLTSDDIVCQADTFPLRKCKAVKIYVQKYKVQIEANLLPVTDRSDFVCLSGVSWDPELTLKDFFYGRAFLKSTESNLSLFQREEAGLQHILSIKDHM